MLKNYKGLKVWQKSYKLYLDIYRISRRFTKEERYGLTYQVRKAVVSIHLDPWTLDPLNPRILFSNYIGE